VRKLLLASLVIAAPMLVAPTSASAWGWGCGSGYGYAPTTTGTPHHATTATATTRLAGGSTDRECMATAPDGASADGDWEGGAAGVAGS
jgi:hypothetical protein